MNSPLWVSIVEARASYLREKYREPTHIYLTHEFWTRLVDGAMNNEIWSLNSVCGMKVVKVESMPEGKTDFYIAG
jgi:hypothetical protein